MNSARASRPASLKREAAFASIPLSELRQGDRRLEGESYLSEGYTMRKQVEASGLPVEPLGVLASVWMPDRLKGTQVAPNRGEPFLTATQVFDIRPRPRKWLAPGHVNELETRYVQPGWILVTRSGSVGDTILSNSLHEGHIVSDDLLRVQADEPEELGYLYAFLRTSYGRAMMRSSKYGSVVKHLQPEHLEKVPVPLLSDRIRKQAGKQQLGGSKRRDDAARRFARAEALYEQQIGNPDSESPAETSYTVTASRLFGRQRRLDGYHYNRDAEGIIRRLRATGKDVVPLHSVTAKAYGVARFKHVYAEDGIPYLDSEDLFKVNPELTKFIPRATKKDPGAYFVQRNWILMACSGQIYGLNGSVVLANEWHENKIVSNHVLRIVPSEGDARPGYLRVVLGHPTLGWPLVTRCAFGTAVPEIAPEDVRDLPVIRLGQDMEDKIADLVESADDLRLQADREEDAATAMVEAELDKLLGKSAWRSDDTDSGSEERQRSLSG